MLKMTKTHTYLRHYGCRKLNVVKYTFVCVQLSLLIRKKCTSCYSIFIIWLTGDFLLSDWPKTSLKSLIPLQYLLLLCFLQVSFSILSNLYFWKCIIMNYIA